MSDLIFAVILILAALFLLLGSIGLVRAPRLFDRCQSVTKAGAFGAMIAIGAASFQGGSLVLFAQSALTIVVIAISSLALGPILAETKSDNPAGPNKHSE